MATIIKIIEKSLIFLSYLRKTVLKGGHTLLSPGISEGIQKKNVPNDFCYLYTASVVKNPSFLRKKFI